MTLPKFVYIPDTNIWSLAGLTKPPPDLVSWMKQVGVDRLALTFPVIAELRRGAHMVEEADPAKSARLFAWVKAISEAGFIEIGMSPNVVDAYAKLTSLKALKNLWCPDPRRQNCKLSHDLMIAAFSIGYGMPIASHNTKDFLKIHECHPLPGVYDPLEGHWLVRGGCDMESPPAPVNERLIPAIQ